MAKKHLKIELRGASDAFGDDGISISFFREYASKLLMAYRRCAQQVLTGKPQEEGRIPNRATELDLRIVKVEHGSMELEAAMVDSSTTPELPSLNLGIAAADKLLEEIEAVHRGGGSRFSRALVETVPGKVNQTYSVYEGGALRRKVTITSDSSDIEEPPPGMARVERVAARVRGIMVDPKNEVVLEVGSRTVRVGCTAEQVAQAFELRDQEDLVATYVTNSAGVTRLLSLRPPVATPERTLDETVERTSGVLLRLAAYDAS